MKCKFQVVERLSADELKKTYNVIDVDGCEHCSNTAGGLLRASNTQPVLVMRLKRTAKSGLQYYQGRDGAGAWRS